MGSDALTFEDDYQTEDVYVEYEGNTIAIIYYVEADNYLIRWWDDSIRVPESGLESAKAYVLKHFKNHL